MYFFLNYFLYILIPLGLGNKQSTSCKTINNGNSIIQKLKSDYRLITFQGTKTNFLPPNLIIVSINIPIACVTKILLSQVLSVGYVIKHQANVKQDKRNYFALVCVPILCFTISNVSLCGMNKEQWFAKFQNYS